MPHNAAQLIARGMDAFGKKIRGKKQMYKKLLAQAHADTSEDTIFRITDSALFNEAIQYFGASLDPAKARYDLQSVYEMGIHKKTGALLICNKGATLFCLSPRTQTPYLLRHIGFSVYVPGLGIEFVNVGLVGNVYEGPVVLRSESACAPSFLFGSQRCNCAHQWAGIQELAAAFNHVDMPAMKSGSAFEGWVQKQAVRVGDQHVFKNAGPGFILVHIDTQNGMGSGFSNGEFAFDLFSRASLRHRGEYSSEQIHKTTMSGGFEAIGLRPDPRRENDHSGYKIGFIILDYLGVSRKIIYLTNNPLKLRHLQDNGYEITRVSLMGEINVAGSQEARERGSDFQHIDINGTCVPFEKDLARLTSEITHILHV